MLVFYQLLDQLLHHHLLRSRNNYHGNVETGDYGLNRNNRTIPFIQHSDLLAIDFFKSRDHSRVSDFSRLLGKMSTLSRVNLTVAGLGGLNDRSRQILLEPWFLNVK